MIFENLQWTDNRTTPLLPWQFDVLTMIRPRRGSIRRMLVRDVSLRGQTMIPDNSDNGGGGVIDFGNLPDLEPLQITRSM